MKKPVSEARQRAVETIEESNGMVSATKYESPSSTGTPSLMFVIAFMS